ncbi:MAG TPA: 50S ribosomal protein L4 [Candidatus Saccharimonadales bacterium]|nr:50S ribosomal protein L4 [Candidatus Saccharimonadales bacterium]
MAVETYTKAGTKAATPAKLDKTVFGVEVKNHQLLKDAYLAYLANGRSNSAVAKKRGEVSGGGRKPWRQKGTGNARFGSSRNPIWRGGGVAFGPTGNENYSRKLSTSAKRTALRQALSLAAKENRIKIIEDLVFADAKTKSAVKLLTKIEASGTVLVVVGEKELTVVRALRNLTDLKILRAPYLNVYDITNADVIVFDKAALETISAWLGDSK